jgi:membrane protein YdbS with pleckstrin-like domain
MSQNFVESRRIARLRPSASRLFLPFLVLATACFVVSFYFDRLPEPWMNIALYSVAGAIAFFFWLLPVLRYLSAYVDVFTTRVLSRSGLMGQQRIEVSYSQVSGVSLGRGRRIEFSLVGGEIAQLPPLPKAKRLVTELQKLVANL